MKFIRLLTACVSALLMSLSPAYAALPKSVSTLLDGAEFSNARISPTGEFISVVMKRDKRRTLIVLDRVTMAPIPGKSVRYEDDDDMEVSGGSWLTDTLFAYAVQTENREDHRPSDNGDLFLLDMEQDLPVHLWNYRGNFTNNTLGKGDLISGFMQPISSLPDDANNILVSVSPFSRDGGVRPALYRMELATGDMKKMITGPARAAQFRANKSGNTVISWWVKPDYTTDFAFRRPDQRWQPLEVDFQGGFQPLRVSDDGLVVYGLTQLLGDINAGQQLVKLTLDTGALETIKDFGFVSEIDVSFGQGGHPAFAQWIGDQPELALFDNSRPAQIVAGFAKSFPGYNIDLVGADDAEDNLIIHVGSPGIMGEYYIWEKSEGKARYLFSSNEAIDQLKLNSFQSVKYQADDGVDLQGWLLMPKNGKPKALVNYIHGGPHGPYIPHQFDERMQIMAELGYAVFAPNFRGSGGYGQNFERAGYLQWGTRMLDDMRQGAEAVKARYGLGEKVYIMGGSYGGYASAQSLVRHSDYYDCSVIIAGVFDLEQQIDTWDAGKGFNTSGYEKAAIGSDPEFLRENSIIHNLDRVKAPMLIVHGREDTRTPMVGAETMVDALKQTKLKYEYHFYDREGHGLYFKPNRIDQYKKVQKFLNRCDRS